MHTRTITPLFSVQEVAAAVDEVQSPFIFQDQPRPNLQAQLDQFTASEAIYVQELQVLLDVLGRFDPRYDNYFDGLNDFDNTDLEARRSAQNQQLLILVRKILTQHNYLSACLARYQADAGMGLLKFSEWALTIHPLYEEYFASYTLCEHEAKSLADLRRQPLLEVHKVASLVNDFKPCVYSMLGSQSQLRLQDIVSNLELASQRFGKLLARAQSLETTEKQKAVSIVDFSDVKCITDLSPVGGNFGDCVVDFVIPSELFYKNDQISTAVNFQFTELVYLKSPTSSPSPASAFSLALVKVEDEHRTLLFPPLKSGELEFFQEVDDSVYLFKHRLVPAVQLYVSIRDKDAQRRLHAKQKLMALFPSRTDSAVSLSGGRIDGLGVFKEMQKEAIQVAHSRSLTRPGDKSVEAAAAEMAATRSFAAHIQKKQARAEKAEKATKELEAEIPVEKVSVKSPNSSSDTSSRSAVSQFTTQKLDTTEFTSVSLDDQAEPAKITKSKSRDEIAEEVLREVAGDTSSMDEFSLSDLSSLEFEIGEPVVEHLHYYSQEDVTRPSPKKLVRRPPPAPLSIPSPTPVELSPVDPSPVSAVSGDAESIVSGNSSPGFDPQRFARTYENVLLESHSHKAKSASLLNLFGGLMGKKHRHIGSKTSRGRVLSPTGNAPEMSPALQDPKLRAIVRSHTQFYLQDVKYSVLMDNSGWTKSEGVKLKWIYTQEAKYLAGFSLEKNREDTVGFLLKFVSGETVVKRYNALDIHIDAKDYRNSPVTVVVRAVSAADALKLVDIFQAANVGEMSSSSSEQSGLSKSGSGVSASSSQTSISQSEDAQSDSDSVLERPPKLRIGCLSDAALTSSTSTVSSSLLNVPLNSSSTVCSPAASRTLHKRRNHCKLVFEATIKLHLICENQKERGRHVLAESLGHAVLRVGDFNSHTKLQYLLRSLKVLLDIDLPPSAFKSLKDNRVLMDASASEQTQGSYVFDFASKREKERFWQIVHDN